QDGVLLGNGTAAISATTGTSDQVLRIPSGGTTPAFGAINLASSNAVSGVLNITNGGSPFDQGNGSIFERIANQDLLLGSNATVSAKFAFLNVNSGIPTASISAGTNGG